MSDTVKIVRPKFPRAEKGPGGRVEHDSRGNAVWQRTRATDSADLPDTSTLSIEDDSPAPDTKGHKPVARPPAKKPVR